MSCAFVLFRVFVRSFHDNFVEVIGLTSTTNYSDHRCDSQRCMCAIVIGGKTSTLCRFGNDDVATEVMAQRDDEMNEVNAKEQDKNKKQKDDAAAPTAAAKSSDDEAARKNTDLVEKEKGQNKEVNTDLVPNNKTRSAITFLRRFTSWCTQTARAVLRSISWLADYLVLGLIMATVVLDILTHFLPVTWVIAIVLNALLFVVIVVQLARAGLSPTRVLTIAYKLFRQAKEQGRLTNEDIQHAIGDGYRNRTLPRVCRLMAYIVFATVTTPKIRAATMLVLGTHVLLRPKNYMLAALAILCFCVLLHWPDAPTTATA
jgi:hypothetical protein